MDLERWIAAPHLEHGLPPAEASGQLVVDGLLQPDKLALLQAFFDGGYGAWEEGYGLSDREPHEVDRETWLSAPDKARFFHFLHWRDNAPTDLLAPPAICHLKLMALFSSPEFIRFLARPFGLAGVRLTGISTRIMTASHEVRRHTDRGGDQERPLCGILYLHRDWRPGYGSALVFDRPGEPARRVEPLPNRLVLFDPRYGMCHYVDPFGAAVGDWRRLNLVVWYGFEP